MERCPDVLWAWSLPPFSVCSLGDCNPGLHTLQASTLITEWCPQQVFLFWWNIYSKTCCVLQKSLWGISTRLFVGTTFALHLSQLFLSCLMSDQSLKKKKNLIFFSGLGTHAFNSVIRGAKLGGSRIILSHTAWLCLKQRNIFISSSMFFLECQP